MCSLNAQRTTNSTVAVHSRLGHCDRNFTECKNEFIIVSYILFFLRVNKKRRVNIEMNFLLDVVIGCLNLSVGTVAVQSRKTNNVEFISFVVWIERKVNRWNRHRSAKDNDGCLRKFPFNVKSSPEMRMQTPLLKDTEWMDQVHHVSQGYSRLAGRVH